MSPQLLSPKAPTAAKTMSNFKQNYMGNGRNTVSKHKTGSYATASLYDNKSFDARTTGREKVEATY